MPPPISRMICMAVAMALIAVGGVNAADIGDTCQVARSGAQGVCQVINNCQPVIDEIVNHNLFPAQCGFRGRDQIVCCPLPPTTTQRPTTQRPTRISQISKFLKYIITMAAQWTNCVAMFAAKCHDSDMVME